MYRQSENVIYNRDFLARQLAAYGTNPAAALAPVPVVGLWQDAAFQPNPATLLAAFAAAEATFSGYARVTPVFSDPINLSPSVQGIIANCLFQGDDTDPFVSNTIYGYFWSSTPGVVMFEKFPEGLEVPIGSTGDFLSLDFKAPASPYQPTV